MVLNLNVQVSRAWTMGLLEARDCDFSLVLAQLLARALFAVVICHIHMGE